MNAAFGQVLILCALFPEAAPLIEALKLSPGPSFGATPLFGLDSPTPLCVSGIGQNAMATAVGLARGQLSPQLRPSFLNVGVSAHQTLPLGTPWLAHQVFDSEADKDPLYPSFTTRTQLPTHPLHTQNHVETAFKRPGGYDMEGHAFLRSALRFASSEQCALLKVVSDGPREHQDNKPFRLNAKKARGLIADNKDAILAQIDHLIDMSQTLTDRLFPPAIQEKILESTHFTQAQTHRLARLLQQWGARFPDDPPSLDSFAAGAQAGLDAMQQALQAYLPLNFSGREELSD